MNIPGEAAKRYPEDYKTIGGNADRRRSFAEGAKWARREALREAAEAVDGESLAFARNEGERGYEEGRRNALTAIRALAEGEQG